MMLNKNSRSQKISAIAQNNHWQYDEFINFSDSIKQANFGLLNYSQNVIFRHVLSADEASFGLGFNYFDCRSVELTGIHNCSVILFNLKFLPSISLDTVPSFLDLHATFSPIKEVTFPPLSAPSLSTGIDKAHFDRFIKLQKLSPVKPHFAFPEHNIFSNHPAQLEKFLDQHLSVCTHKQTSDTSDTSKTPGVKLSDWLLAHPNLHIEISSGMLLAYQPNHLLNDEDIIPAIEHVSDISKSLSL